MPLNATVCNMLLNVNETLQRKVVLNSPRQDDDDDKEDRKRFVVRSSRWLAQSCNNLELYLTK